MAHAPSANTVLAFVSETFRDVPGRAVTTGPTRYLLLELIKQRCRPPLQALWIERNANVGEIRNYRPSTGH